NAFDTEPHSPAECEQMAWLAMVSSTHARKRRAARERARLAEEERAQLQWLASFSAYHEGELRRQLMWESDPRARFERPNEPFFFQEADWDPAKHPRRAAPPNAGWFATTSGAGGAGSAA